MESAGVAPRSCAMVGSAMLAIEVTSTDMATAIATASMARQRCVGGNPSVISSSCRRIGGGIRPCVLDPVGLRQQGARMEFPTCEGVVLPEWIDANGHMNLAYYVVLFDLATDAMY